LKLLLDNNLLHKLLVWLEILFHGSQHVRNTVGIDADDSAVWEYALKNNFVILTKDNDFDERSLVNGCPPKVVHLICGNKSSEYILGLIVDNKDELISFGTVDIQNCILKLV
jgi:predicted nuclease of predicted toxin-antitoxin system